MHEAIETANEDCNHTTILITEEMLILDAPLPPILSPINITSLVGTTIMMGPAHSKEADGFRVFSGPFILSRVHLILFSVAVITFNDYTSVYNTTISNCNQGIRLASMSSHGILDNVVVSNVTSNAAVIVSGKDHLLRELRIFQAYQNGIVIRSAAAIVLENCIASNCGGSGLSSSYSLHLNVTGGCFGDVPKLKHKTFETNNVDATTTQPASSLLTTVTSSETSIDHTPPDEYIVGGNRVSGIVLQTTARAKLEDVSVDSNNDTGIVIRNGCQDIVVYGSKMFHNKRRNVHIHQARNIVIGGLYSLGNSFLADGFTMQHHILAQHSAYITLEGNIFESNETMHDIYKTDSGTSTGEEPNSSSSSFVGVSFRNCQNVTVGNRSPSETIDEVDIASAIFGGSSPSGNIFADKDCYIEMDFDDCLGVTIADNHVGFVQNTSTPVTTATFLFRIHDVRELSMRYNGIIGKLAMAGVHVSNSGGDISHNVILPKDFDQLAVHNDTTGIGFILAIVLENINTPLRIGPNNVFGAREAAVVLRSMWSWGIQTPLIYGNQICVSSDGQKALTPLCKIGIHVTNTAYNAAIGIDGFQPNVIYGHKAAIQVDGQARIQGNYIGVSRLGDGPLTSITERKSFVHNRSKSTIGFDSPHGGDFGILDSSGESLILSNLIGGFRSAGIHFHALNYPFGMRFENNFVGSNAEGTIAIPNYDGILVTRCSHFSLRGYNQVSGNHRYGVYVHNCEFTDVFGMIIGGAQNGISSLSNGNVGVFVTESTRVSIGNTQFYGENEYDFDDYNNLEDKPAETVPDKLLSKGPFPRGNLIVGNNNTGVVLRHCVNCRIAHNFVGIGLGSSPAIPNEDGGVLLHAASNAMLINNTISGNNGVGVTIVLSNNTLFVGNRVGTNIAGTHSVSNTAHGIELHSSSSTVFAPQLTAFSLSMNGNFEDDQFELNTISGNKGSGLLDTSFGTILSGGYFGVDSSGNKELSNEGNGLLLKGTGTIVGADPEPLLSSFADGYWDSEQFAVPWSAVVVSGNKRHGIRIDGAQEIFVRKVIIGLAFDEETPIPNSLSGISLRNSHNIHLGQTPEPAITTTTSVTTVTTAFQTSGITHTMDKDILKSPSTQANYFTDTSTRMDTYTTSTTTTAANTSGHLRRSAKKRAEKFEIAAKSSSLNIINQVPASDTAVESQYSSLNGISTLAIRKQRSLLFAPLVIIGSNNQNGIDILNCLGVMITSAQIGVSKGLRRGNGRHGVNVRGSSVVTLGAESAMLLVLISNNDGVGLRVEELAQAIFRSVGFSSNKLSAVEQQTTRQLPSIVIGTFAETSATVSVTVPKAGLYIIQAFAATECLAGSPSGQAERLLASIEQSLPQTTANEVLHLSWSSQTSLNPKEVVTATIATANGSLSSNLASCRGPERDLELCSICVCMNTTADCSSTVKFVPTRSANSNITRLLMGSNNLLGKLDSSLFDDLPKLEELDLSNIGPNAFDEDVFNSISQLNHLKILDLSSNKLMTMNGFSFGSSLERLDLSFNAFSDNPLNFSHRNALRQLILDGNIIEVLRKDGFLGASSLTGLSIRNNLLRSIESGAFNGLEKLQILDLSSVVSNVTFPVDVLAGLTQLTAINWVSESCPQGFVSAFSMGGSVCLPCPRGSFSLGGRMGSLLDCEACEAGHVDHDEDPVTPCISCPLGTYTDPGSFAECPSCSPGTVDAEQNPSIPCRACSPGSFANQSSFACEPCINGTTDEDSFSGTPCAVCGPGTDAPENKIGPCIARSSGVDESRADQVGVIIGVIVAIALIVIILVVIIATRRVRRIKNEQKRELKAIQESAKLEFERLLSKYDDNQKLNAAQKFDRLQISRMSFETIKQLGSGEFGVVELGRMIHGGKKVAIKRLRVKGVDADEQSKFLQEARLMAILEHSNIVRLQGVCTLEPPFLMVLELMPNGDLRSYLKSRTSDSKHPTQVVLTQTIIGIAHAMTYLEANHILHRDLAARNVLVGESLPNVKLADFGMSRPLEEKEYYRKHSNDRVPLKWYGLFTNNYIDLFS